MSIYRYVACVMAFVSAAVSSDELKELYRNNVPSVVAIESQDPFGNVRKYGTGFYVADGCWVATNAHVIKGGYRVKSQGENGKSEVLINPKVKINAEFDLAVFQVQSCGRPLPLDNASPEVGDHVFTIGNPQGLSYSLSDGLVSGIRSEESKIIQTTASISPGSSGGPLLNMAGKVVGITTFYLEDGQNLNFAIPSAFLASLMSAGNEIELAQNYPDRSDAVSVAAAFFFAVRNRDLQRALSFVESRYEAGFRREMGSDSSKLPLIPENAVLEPTIGAPIDGAPHVEVAIKGSSIGVDLVKYGDRWWVVK